MSYNPYNQGPSAEAGYGGGYGQPVSISLNRVAVSGADGPDSAESHMPCFHRGTDALFAVTAKRAHYYSWV